MNKKTKNTTWFLKLFPILLVSLVTFSGINNVAHAVIIFQDDTISQITSDSIQIGSNDSGSTSTALLFGANENPLLNATIMWDINTNKLTVDKTTSISGGLSATGKVDFSTASEFHMREISSTTAACTTVNEQALYTVDKKIYVCTVAGNPGTWTSPSGGSQDFEGVYTTDSDKILTTSNAAFTITTGTNDFIVDSNDWNITAAGALDAATVTSNGLFTGSAGSNISGAAINLNFNSNFATNINTGSSTGQVTLGGNSNCVNINSNTWDISCAGAGTGFTGLTSSGTINFSSATSFRIPEAASDPGTCTKGEQYFNTTTSTVRLCESTNLWTSTGATGKHFVFAYDTTTQNVTSSNVFKDITFNENGELDGWTHTAGTTNFTSNSAGSYLATISARVSRTGPSTTASIRGVLNGTEISGSQAHQYVASTNANTIASTFIFTAVSNDIFKIQFTGGNNQVRINPGGSGTTLPSIQLSIIRLE